MDRELGLLKMINKIEILHGFTFEMVKARSQSKLYFISNKHYMVYSMLNSRYAKFGRESLAFSY